MERQTINAVESSQNEKSHRHNDNHENTVVETIASQLTEYVRIFPILLLLLYI